MQTRVFHTRLANFFVHAERLVDPSLATRPIAITTSHAQNSTILALSDEAQSEGLRKGMHLSLARKISRISVLLPFHGALYQKVQNVLFGRLAHFSPAVEPAGYGRFFLDMSGMESIFRSPGHAGHLMVRELTREMAREPRIGIGRNKLVSAIATRMEGDDPVYEVPQGEEPAFLAPLRSITLPVAREKPVRQIMADLNLFIIRDVQQLIIAEHLRQVVFGTFARQVAAQAQGIDTAVVRPMQLGAAINADHIVERHVLTEETNDEGLLFGAAQLLSETAGHQLRVRGRIAGKISLKVHYSDGYEGQATGRVCHNDTVTVTAEIVRLYRRANYRRGRVRAMTVDASQLTPFADQMSLFGLRQEHKQGRLSIAIDAIQRRYGDRAILPLSAAAHWDG